MATMRSSTVIRRTHTSNAAAAAAAAAAASSSREEKKEEDAADTIQRQQQQQLHLDDDEEMNKDRRRWRQLRHRHGRFAVLSDIIFKGGRFSSSSLSDNIMSLRNARHVTGLLVALGGLLLLFLLLYLISHYGSSSSSSANGIVIDGVSYHVDTNLKVTINSAAATVNSNNNNNKNNWAGPQGIGLPGPFISTKEDFYAPHYGHLDFDFLGGGGGEDDHHDHHRNQFVDYFRNITYTRDDKLFAPNHKTDSKYYEHQNKYYYAFDDDEKRNPYHGWGKDSRLRHPKKYHCRQTAMHREMFSTCNDFHAFDFTMYASQDRGSYLGGGAFRDVFMIKKENGDPLVVLKTASYGIKYKPHNWEFYHMDAAVASAVTPHPLFVDVYGACGLAMLSQPMRLGDVNEASLPRYSRHHCDRTSIEGHSHLVPMNDLNATTKLEWALQMAESIAVLHYHPRGVIVHDDVQPYQWLVAEDGNIKLNDFNRAEFMLYDEEHGEYCKYKNGVGPGDFRAPEEYFNKPLDEKIDIFSLGNNFYGLLAGVYPMYDICSDDKAGKKIRDGGRPFIDPRWMDHSFAEAELVKAIDDCWHRHPENRVSAAELVIKLRKSVRKNRELLAMGLEKLPETATD